MVSARNGLTSSEIEEGCERDDGVCGVVVLNEIFEMARYVRLPRHNRSMHPDNAYRASPRILQHSQTNLSVSDVSASFDRGRCYGADGTTSHTP